MDCTVFDINTLNELDLSENEIKSVYKKKHLKLTTLNLRKNKLKDIDGILSNSLINLDISKNR